MDGRDWNISDVGKERPEIYLLQNKLKVFSKIGFNK